MKLAFCLVKYFPYGGLQRDFLRIAKESIKRGHQIKVFTNQWHGERPEGIDIVEFKIKAAANHRRYRAFVGKLEQALKAEHFDKVIGFNKLPNLDFYYAADPCYLAKAHEDRPFAYRCLNRYRALVDFERAVFAPNKKTDILCISPSEKKRFQHYYGTPSARFLPLPPGICRDRKRPENAHAIRVRKRQELGLTDQHRMLLQVGSGFKTKGLDRSIAALASLPSKLKAQTKLFIAGLDAEGPFRRQAASLGVEDQVIFLGGRDDVPELLLAADLLTHPAYRENTGTVLLEAMVAGLPVLTTDQCGYSHYIRDADAGVVLPSPFEQSILDRVLSSMLTSDKSAAWQKNALTFVEHADIYSLPQRAVDHIEAVH